MKTLDDISIDDYLECLAQRNLVYNHNFIYFSNRNGTDFGTPDGWVYTDAGNGGSISFDEETKQCVITKSEGGEQMSFTQALHEFPRWKQTLLGEVVTGKVILNTSIDGKVDVSISDGVNQTTYTILKHGNHEVDLQFSISDEATQLILSVESDAPFVVIGIESCNVNIGGVSINNLPCIINGIIGERKQYIATENPPAGELSLCNAPVELDHNYTRLNSVLNGRFGTGNNGNSMLIDMRGYFSRAWDNGASVDPNANERTSPGTGIIKGDHVSTFEQDDFLKHDHGLGFTVNSTQSTTGGTGLNTNLVVPANSKTDETPEGKETRSKNIAELYTIKWA